MAEAVKIWVDDIREAPEGYVWARSVDEAIDAIRRAGIEGKEIELLDLDHDAGDYYKDGGDYIRVLDFLEGKPFHGSVRIHSANVVGRENMMRICDRNGWTVVA